MEKSILQSQKENQKLIDEFLLSLKKESKSKSSINGHRALLRRFMKEVNMLFSDITTEDIRQWIEERQKNLNHKMKPNHLWSLRSFYRFCVEKGYMEISPVPFRGKVQGSAEQYWEVKRPLPNSENQRVINEFLLSQKQANRGAATVIRFRKKLTFFFKDQENLFATLTTDAIKEWIAQHEKKWKLKTKWDYVGSVRSFYDYCEEKAYVKVSPMHNLKKKKEETYWVSKIPLLNKKNQTTLNEFLLDLKVSNLSRATILSYRYCLQTFFLNQKECFLNLTSKQILDWLNHFQIGRKKTTLNNHLNALASFYAFCVKEGYLEKSPIKSRWYPRLPKPVPKYLTKEEVAKVRRESEKGQLRDRVLIEFLLCTGCRVGEVHQLNRTDVDFEQRTAMVNGKGRKIRLVNFTEKCSLLLERYMDSRIDLHPALFVSSIGKTTRLSIVRMQKILVGIGESAGLSGSFHPHRLRHTFATDLLEKGADLSFIANELGHSDMISTQIYANVTNRKILSMYRKFMG